MTEAQEYRDTTLTCVETFLRFWDKAHCSWKSSTQVTANFSLLLSACEASWPLCVCFLICHFTPLSFKCHTVASTSLLTGEWPPMMAVRLVGLLLCSAHSIILISLLCEFKSLLSVGFSCHFHDTLLCESFMGKNEQHRVNRFVFHVTRVASAERLCF